MSVIEGVREEVGDSSVVLALSKGRILDETIPLLRRAGIELLDDPSSTRKLVLATNMPNLSVVIIRATDVPTFVEYGVADLGVSGKDVLIEHGSTGVYELLDLEIARCRLMVAWPEATGSQMVSNPGRLRVATKFTRIARSYFQSQGRQVDLIKLYGSMELAPIVGLADCIVDVVDTGNTLKANGLVPVEELMQVSSRLVANKASMKLKHDAIRGMMERLSAALAAV